MSSKERPVVRQSCLTSRTIRLAALFLLSITGLTSAQNSFSIRSVVPETNGALTVTWPAWPTWTYHVLSADTPTGAWTEADGGKLTAGSNVFALSYTDASAATASQRFYKVSIHYTQLIMSLVLDRSGSMNANGGSTALSPAVSSFIDYFNDSSDKVAMVSFSSAASVDVTMQQPFKSTIKAAVSNLTFAGYTCSEQGLLKAWQQNQSAVVTPGDEALKVIVFFTDGLANGFNYTFNCGARNICNSSGGILLFDPTTGNAASTGCTVPATISSIDPAVGTIDPTFCPPMHDEAERRALAIANQARQDGIIIYAIGFGTSGLPECNRPSPNILFLQEIANDPNSSTYNPAQPAGYAVIATTTNALQTVFQTIAAMIQTY